MTDDFTVTGGGDIFAENQTLVDTEIGDANYDLGVVFVTGACCAAAKPSVCDSGNKAKNYSEFNDLKTTCHEIGHQFDAGHTWNSCNAGTGSQYDAAAAHEVASGTSIMSYNGICGTDDVPNPGDLTYFTVGSYEQINDYIATINCQTTSATGNNPPVVTVPTSNFYIPIGTPFELIGNASDIDGDILTYSWEQYNIGPHAVIGSQTGNSPALEILILLLVQIEYFQIL